MDFEKDDSLILETHEKGVSKMGQLLNEIEVFTTVLSYLWGSPGWTIQ